MSLKHFWTLITVLSVTGAATLVHAQVDVPGPRFEPRAVQSPENTRPLAEPFVFDYDAQVFAPVEFTNDKELEPNTGFFFVVDRMYNSVSRGEPRDLQGIGITPNDVPTGNDWMWGNRFELGWMGQKDSGWQVVYEKTAGSFFAFGQDILVSNPMLVNTTYTSLEVNRMFRQSISNGDYFDPYIGLRYFGLSDRTIEDTTFDTVDGDGNAVTASNRFKQNAKNSSVGAQIGGRYNHRRGRFRYTLDGALAAMYNHQSYFATDLTFVNDTTGIAEFYDNGQAFTPVGDLRCEIAYNFTRDIALRTGFQAQYIWDGVARTDNLTTVINPNSVNSISGGAAGVFSESVIVAGFNFGIEWRR
jgi:hypothetical protein